MENNKEELFEIEETIDFEKLRKENHKKYREVYLQVEKLGSKPYQLINKAELKKLQSMDLYYDALKTGFFIEEYTEKLGSLAMDRETVESIRRDVAKVCGKDKSKYEELLFYVEHYYRRTYPRPKDFLLTLIYAIVATLIITVFLIIGVYARKAIFFVICMILLCASVVGAFFVVQRWKKPLK